MEGKDRGRETKQRSTAEDLIRGRETSQGSVAKDQIRENSSPNWGKNYLKRQERRERSKLDCGWGLQKFTSI